MLITEEYRKQNEILHNELSAYGRGGAKHAEQIILLSEIYKAKTVLDYGCGKGKFKEEMDRVSKLITTNYDPAIPEFSKEPNKSDIVVCTDVLEHIEPECLNNVINDIRNLAIKLAYIVIATKPDLTKRLPDGRDPHLIVKNKEYWITKLREFFNSVIKTREDSRTVTFLCQQINLNR